MSELKYGLGFGDAFASKPSEADEQKQPGQAEVVDFRKPGAALFLIYT